MQALNDEANVFYGRCGFRPFPEREPLMVVLRLSELKALVEA